MSRIRIPDLFAGDYEHVVITTFSAQLAFYERALVRSMRGARTQILLVDRDELRSEIADRAEEDSLLYVNREYLAVPVRSPGGAHAKLILLIGPKKGVLLVGSGNLGLRGYTEWGELFLRYDYPAKGHDASFGAARMFLEALGDLHYLDRRSTQALDRIWEGTPWLAEAPSTGSPLRHNLKRSLLEHLTDMIHDEPVDELIVHAPFWDQDCSALEQLVRKLKPSRVRVLVQAGVTSVDGSALAKALKKNAGKAFGVGPRKGGRHRNMHAKFILVRTAKRSICLQGSGNMTLAGLCLPHERGNIELANLLEGPPGAFDDMLKDLSIDATPIDLAKSDLTLLAPRPAAEQRRFGLFAATWTGESLELELTRALPSDAVVVVMARERPIARLAHPKPALVLTIPITPQEEALAHATPLHLRIELKDGVHTTNPVYPYHEPALRTAFRDPRRPDLLARIGGLELDDAELEELLEQLRETLIIDPARLPTAIKVDESEFDAADEESAPHLAWEDIDWSSVRRHPRYMQYRNAAANERSDLQIVLNAIGQQFQAALVLVAAPRAGSGPALPQAEFDDTASTPSQISAQKRARLLWRNLFRRCLRAIESEKFAEMLGPQVVIANAVIVDHLIRALEVRRILDFEFALAMRVRLYERLLGDGESPGYLGGLSGSDASVVMAEMKRLALPTRILGELFRSASHSRGALFLDERLELRGACRAFVSSDLLGIALGDLAAAIAWGGASDSATFVREIRLLAEFVLVDDLEAELAREAGTSPGRVHLTDVKVRRGGGPELVLVEQLDLEDQDLVFAPEMASRLISTWEAAAGGDYFRVKHRPTSRLAFVDLASGERVFHPPQPLEGFPAGVTLPPPVVVVTPWRLGLEKLGQTAAKRSKATRSAG